MDAMPCWASLDAPQRLALREYLKAVEKSEKMARKAADEERRGREAIERQAELERWFRRSGIPERFVGLNPGNTEDPRCFLLGFDEHLRRIGAGFVDRGVGCALGHDQHRSRRFSFFVAGAGDDRNDGSGHDLHCASRFEFGDAALELRLGSHGLLLAGLGLRNRVATT